MKSPCSLAALWLICTTSNARAQGQNQHPIIELPHLGETLDNESPLIALHRQLIAHESISGNELPVAEWLASYLESHNLTVTTQVVSSNRTNVLAFQGSSHKTDVLVSSHIDTVPPFWPYEYRKATSGNSDEDEIWGRGSVDAKACVAAQTIAVLDLLTEARAADSAPPSVGLLFVVGEETGGDGMRHFSAHKPNNYSAVVFGEPTEGKLVAGHKGMLGFKVMVKGKAAHSGYPWLGLSANNVLVEALAKLQVIEEWLPSSEKYGLTTVNVGRIEGGVAANVVAEEASANIAVRVADETPEVVKKLIEDGLATTIEEVEKKGGKLWFEYGAESYGPVDIDVDVPGFDSMTVNYGTDVPWLKGDHKRYLYGPGSIFVAHSDHEHLKRGELEKAVGDYKRIIKTVLGRI